MTTPSTDVIVLPDVRYPVIDDILDEAIIDPVTAASLREDFVGYLPELTDWKEKALALNVTSEEQVLEMKEAREARLALVKVRTGADGKRKELKADALAFGKLVQSLYNAIAEEVRTIEEHLKHQEEFALRAEQSRRVALREERMEKLAAFPGFYPTATDYANIDEGTFNAILKGAEYSMIQHRHQMEAKQKEEQEAARILEEEKRRQAVENTRLRKQAEQDAEARRIAENEARQLREQEQVRIAAEQEAAAAQEAEEQRALHGTDQEKFAIIHQNLTDLSIPEMESVAGRRLVMKIIRLIGEATGIANNPTLD